MKYLKLFFLLAILLVAFFLYKYPPDSQAQASYDLAAESIAVSPESPEVNQAVIITIKVRNMGAQFNLEFPINNSLRSTSFVNDGLPAYSPGTGSTIKTGDYITFTYSGHFTLLQNNSNDFSFDLTGYLGESDMTNNAIGKNVYVKGNDLIAESIIITPPNPTVNQLCKIEIAVKNNGTYNIFSTTGLIPLYAFPDYTITKSAYTNPSVSNYIKPGDYIYYNYEGNFTSVGEKSLSFTVDPEDQLKQSDISNNAQTTKINVLGGSDTDLAVDSLTLSSDKLIMGEAVDITVNIKNTGKTSLVSANGFSISDITAVFPYFDNDINSISHDSFPTVDASFEPGAFFHYIYNGRFNNSGTFKLVFSLNKNNSLTEADKNNNSTSTSVTVYKDLKAADEINITDKIVSLISSTSAKIIWSTNKNSTGFIYYAEDHDNIYNNQVDVTDNVNDHTVTIINLRPTAKYNYIIKAVNGTEEKIDSISSFTTPANDNLAIAMGPSLEINTVNKTAVISWTTNLISSGYVNYKKKEGSEFKSLGLDALTSAHQIKLETLELGQYDYFITGTSTFLTVIKPALYSFEQKENSQPAATAAQNNVSSNNALSQPIGTTIQVKNINLYNRLKGSILLKVQSKGEAYYINAKTKTLHYLGRPEDAFRVIREQGQGITNANLVKIPLGLSNLSGTDSDQDGLPNAFEQAIGTDKNKADTDGDGFSDKDELIRDYSPIIKGQKMNYDKSFANSLKGRIFLQVQSHGEAWYVNPADGKRYFLARPTDAFNIMRKLGLGITNSNFEALSK